MRIEIKLTKEVADALKAKAEALNHSRKSFIEYLCIQEAKKSVAHNKQHEKPQP